MQRSRRTWLLFWVMAPWFLLLIVAIVGLRLYSRPVTITGRAATLKPVSTPAAPVAWPAFGQEAIGTVEDGILAENGAQTPVPTASTAKIMTALAVLQKKPLKANEQGPTITIDANDVAKYNQYFAEGGSLARVSLGEQISEYQALQALMLPSANNFAYTLAKWAYGSEDAYLTYANGYAKQLGMDHTHFSDASGFEPQTVSTAHDMLLLARQAVKQPAFAQIVSQPSATIPVAGAIYNVNIMLGTNGIDGIKTGNTDQAGGAFIFSAKQAVPGGKTKEVLGAVMGAPDLTAALRSSPALVTSTAGGFSEQSLASVSQTVGSYTLPWNNQRVTVVPKNDSKQLLFGGSVADRTVKLDSIDGARHKGDHVGTLTVSIGKRKISEPVVLTADVPAAPFTYRLTHK